ncbi:hypothetical protein H4R34_003208 [Dimargaris verticillata]|uniref:rRNA adenine N(6)-methyltransferase n=1 Tax=Dimargaris verticillata TaxID=2761393 RepID=A0A9W8B0E5_9FUNG|nr:hypothetical protein H4R34_003208 [Dimargaris verticillata]
MQIQDAALLLRTVSESLGELATSFTPTELHGTSDPTKPSASNDNGSGDDSLSNSLVVKDDSTGTEDSKAADITSRINLGYGHDEKLGNDLSLLTPYIEWIGVDNICNKHVISVNSNFGFWPRALCDYNPTRVTAVEYDTKYHPYLEQMAENSNGMMSVSTAEEARTLRRYVTTNLSHFLDRVPSATDHDKPSDLIVTAFSVQSQSRWIYQLLCDCIDRQGLFQYGAVPLYIFTPKDHADQLLANQHDDKWSQPYITSFVKAAGAVRSTLVDTSVGCAKSLPMSLIHFQPHAERRIQSSSKDLAQVQAALSSKTRRPVSHIFKSFGVDVNELLEMAEIEPDRLAKDLTISDVDRIAMAVAAIRFE